MSSRTNLAILVIFAALTVLGATMAFSATGLIDTTGVSSAYAQDNMTGGNITGGNITGGNITGGMNMTA